MEGCTYSGCDGQSVGTVHIEVLSHCDVPCELLDGEEGLEREIEREGGRREGGREGEGGGREELKIHSHLHGSINPQLCLHLALLALECTAVQHWSRGHRPWL